MASSFPTLRWPKLRRILGREPLKYRVVRTKGSHRLLKSDAGYPDLYLAFHDNADIPGSLVRKILCGDIGLTEEEARGLI
jgi:predicted RNA binding protein YcfA (HicA-like mRNA interferase family)